MNGKSDDEIYERIREGGLGIAIQLEHTMAMVFPEGLHEAKEEQIEIVAMTPESVFLFRSANLDCPLTDRCSC